MAIIEQRNDMLRFMIKKKIILVAMLEIDSRWAGIEAETLNLMSEKQKR